MTSSSEPSSSPPFSDTVATDGTGGGGQGILFYPWGQAWTMAGTAIETRFASLQHRDSETSLDPTLFRAYNSRLGRWLSPDPLGGNVFNPQSLNRYAYALNNPLRYTDPSGLDCVYLNNEGDSVSSIDQQIDQSGCHDNGGYWVEGTVTNFNVDENGNYVFTSLSGPWGNLTEVTTTYLSETNTNPDVSEQAYAPLFDPVAYYNAYVNNLRQQYWSPPTPEQYVKAIAANMPTACGGGVFGYFGVGKATNGTEGFIGGLLEYDSKAGWSLSPLGEAGSEKASAGVALTDKGFQPMLFIPAGPVGAYGGLVVGKSGAAGLYVGTPIKNGMPVPAAGAGAYVNVTTAGSCH